MSRDRKTDSPKEKVANLKRHRVEKVPVSDRCDELGLNPTVLYAWQKQFFENGATALPRAWPADSKARPPPSKPPFRAVRASMPRRSARSNRIPHS